MEKIDQDWGKWREEKLREYTDLDNGGFWTWAVDFVPEYVSNFITDYHKQIVSEVFDLFDPRRKNMFNRRLELINFRGSGKSTILNFLVPLYILLFNKQDVTINGAKLKLNRKFIITVSKTGMMAEDFAVRLRDELSTNKMIKYFFKGKVQSAKDAEDGQWTRRAFAYNGCNLMSVGTGQQIRGRIKGAARPDLIIFDDLYDEENVVTIERRAKIRSWFNAGAMNTLNPLTGMAILTGTILHEDTVLIDAKKDSGWKTILFPIMDIIDFKNFIAEHVEVNYNNGFCKLKYDEVEDEYKKIALQEEYYNNLPFKTVWEDRFTMYYIAQLFQSAVKNGTTSLFYQEYFHEVIAHENKRFLPEMFQEIQFQITYEYSYQWIEAPIYDSKKMITLELGIDLGGGSVDSDDTVIAIAGKTKDHLFIPYVSFGKYKIRDLKNQDGEVINKGYIDEIIRILKIFPGIKKIKLGVAGEEILHVEEIRRVLMDNNLFEVMVIPQPQTRAEGNKIERIKNILLPYFELYRVYLLPGMEKLKYELEFLGKATSDNLADGLAVAVKNISHYDDLSIEHFENIDKPKKVPFWKKHLAETPGWEWRIN